MLKKAQICVSHGSHRGRHHGGPICLTGTEMKEFSSPTQRPRPLKTGENQVSLHSTLSIELVAPYSFSYLHYITNLPGMAPFGKHCVNLYQPVRSQAPSYREAPVGDRIEHPILRNRYLFHCYKTQEGPVLTGIIVK